MSERFEIISYRENKKYKIEFSEGNLVESVKSSSLKKEKHGTTIIMKPSQLYMGEDCEIHSAELIEWLEKIVYLIPTGIKINLSVKKKGKESLITKKYTNKNGIVDYIPKLCKKPLLEPVQFIKTMKMKEVNRGKEFDRFIGLEVAFTYSSDSVEFTSDSFCNYVNTVDGGQHVDAVKTGILQYLTKQTRDNLSEREAKNLDITFNDATQGLVLTVNLSTTLNPGYTGQTKQKVGNSELFKPLRDMTYKSLVDYFKKNPKDLKKLTDKVKINAKARIESTKVRNSVIRGERNNFSEHMMKNFEAANNTGKEYKELFIVEGDSAMGSVKSGRFDNDTQALLALRGVPLNAFGTKLDKVLLNKEFFALVKILGTNIGAKFDISKLKYNKIIIMTDSDADGYNISSLVCAFFITHMPEIVKGGYLYKSIAPLYHIKDKEKPFINTKQQYIEVFEKRIRKNLKIINPDTKVVYKESEVQELLMQNRDYLEELIRVSKRLAINPIVLEFICINYGDSKIKKKVKKRFPEITIDDDNVLTGIYDGRYQILVMDKIFDKNIKGLLKLINEVNKKNVFFLVHEIKGKSEFDDRGVMSLGELLMLSQKFQPTIITRYKGLGELNSDDLRDTTLDPNNRILVRLTAEDIDRELEQFNILHGNDSKARKDLMHHFKINREDLDN